MDYIAVLGRLSKLSLAELERVYGAEATTPLSASACLVKNAQPDVQKLGGITKAGRLITRLPARTWPEVNKEIIRLYTEKWQNNTGKQTLGISVYDWNIAPRDVQKTGLQLKSSLKRHSVSLRLIPNADTALNTATSHHNKLGLSDNKTELLIIKTAKDVVIAESIGAQNITALARRDQGRPKRDAFVGMLPPKLAMMMINMSGITNTSPIVSSGDVRRGSAQNVSSPDESILGTDRTAGPESSTKRILDPFCGTGVLLQEAALLGLDVYGTDLSEKMIDYSSVNLDWLAQSHSLSFTKYLEQGDAMTAQWQPPIDAVIAECYLGQPFSAPPSPKKLQEVRGNCNHIISTFLQNIATQIPADTPLCLAVPAWRDNAGQLTHLPLTQSLEPLGYLPIQLTHVNATDLIYSREDQVVARQLLLLTRI